jgi:hypothetical protein
MNAVFMPEALFCMWLKDGFIVKRTTATEIPPRGPTRSPCLPTSFPKAAKTFVAGLVEVSQISEVTRGEVRHPLVQIIDAGVVKQLKTVAAGFAFVGFQFRELFFGRVLLDFGADAPVVLGQIPLNGVTEEMRDDEDGVLHVDVVIDVDFAAAKIAAERIGNIIDGAGS